MPPDQWELPDWVMTRDEWGARPPTKVMAAARGYPWRHLFIHHTVTTPSRQGPADDARTVQTVAFSRGFADTSYTFTISPDGTACEGRELRWVGGHTRGWNSTALAISLIGNYENLNPTVEQMHAGRELVQWLVWAKFLHPGVTIRGHRDVAATACPGRHAYDTFLPAVRRWADQPRTEEEEEMGYIHEVIPPDSIMYTIAVPPPGAGLVPAGRVFVSFGVDSEPTQVRAVAGRPDHWQGLGPEGAWEFEVPVGRKVWAELRSGDEVVSIVNYGPRHVGVLVEVGKP